ncbi:MAG TPA: histidine kinase [Candidatus Acidoferrales bacterium]|jgi:two-component system LytT family sensor kinase|nr:histidine kinase [Candidatus Acidoferrales bacterium]
MLLPSPPTIRRWVKYWLAWTAAGLFYITQDFMTRLSRNEAILWRNVVIGWMAAMYICAAFTPTILWLGRRWPVEGAYRRRRIALHLFASVAFSLVSTALEVPVLTAIGILPAFMDPMSFVKDFWILLPYDLHGGVIRYWAVVGLQALFRSNQEARRREREAMELKVHSSQLAEQLASSQLSALKMQMHPHFLFNTLGAIMVLVRQRKEREAETMLSRLSDLLRRTLEDVEAQEVPLWRELDFLRIYLSIEQVRFEDRLCVRIDAGPEVSDALVPHLALQPIVENAVRHGLGQSEEPVLIHVSVSRADGHLTLTVTDDGPGCSAPVLEERGIGLANTRNRLTRLYGAKATFSAENRLPRGVQVTMTLPYRTGRPEDEECA